MRSLGSAIGSGTRRALSIGLGLLIGAFLVSGGGTASLAAIRGGAEPASTAPRRWIEPAPVALPALQAPRWLPGQSLGAAQDVSGPQSLELREVLMRKAAELARMSYVPYVWGGNALGDASTCGECRKCIMGKRRLSVERRAKVCSACRQCGVDCSHFVNRVYEAAGLAYPYVSTKPLTRMRPEDIKRKFGLVSIGRDLRLARPGDILLHERHVTMLLRLIDAGHADILHVSRSTRRHGAGGVEIVRNADVLHFRGKLVRIFRHQALMDGAPERSPSPAPALSELVARLERSLETGGAPQAAADVQWTAGRGT
jgi:cell wall-associated NlpC family hydrolase